MAQKIEWRFTEPSVLSVGHWYLDWGDPNSESLLTLTQVIWASDNPLWCLREHANVLVRIVDGADDVLEDLATLGSREDGLPMRLAPESPMVTSILNALRALRHALALMVDAMVECRKGPIETAMRSDHELAGALAFAISDAVNCVYRLESHLPRFED